MISTHLKLAGGRGWAAGVVNYDADEPKTLTSIASCAARPDGVEARERTVRIPAQSPGDPPATVDAKCHRGERLAFGGFDYDRSGEPGRSSDASLSELRRVGGRGWRVGAFNSTGKAPLTAIAYCSEQAPRTTTAKETVAVEPSGRARVNARCHRGERLAFGGYSADVGTEAAVMLHGLERTSARTWRVSARSTTETAAGKLTAYAYCAPR